MAAQLGLGHSPPLTPTESAVMLFRTRCGSSARVVPGTSRKTGFANYSAFIAAGYDNGTVIKADMPSADLILQWARQLLF